MTTFAYTTNPTPFGFFNEDVDFQKEADSMISFVKRKLGDDILSVELTKKQIWACFEESFLEYGRIVNEADAKSQLGNLLGITTGSTDVTGKFPRQNLEYLLRMAEPYAMDAGIGGSYNDHSGSIQLRYKIQDYDLYEELKDSSGTLIVSSSKNNPRSKMKIREVFHFSPQAAYRFFDTTSAINYLNNEFSFESFTPETVFYVLPVFEDVLRAGQMDISNRVRKSNYSYRVIGSKLRIYPMPTESTGSLPKLWVRVAFNPNPLDPDIEDGTIYGASNLSNVPYGRMQYNKTNSVGRQWVRQYTLATCTDLLGQVRSKFQSVPIPSGDLQLNGADLVSQGREDQGRLRDQLVELLDSLTYHKLLELQATDAENITRALKAIPMPLGQSIIIK
tara:strand:+ start:689 stop:1861 length:1173 start_codon:yes stop_codon:yes gene_type:complete